MSKAAKQSIAILLILLCAALAFAFVASTQKQNIEKKKVSLEQQLKEYQNREALYKNKNEELRGKIKTVEDAKLALEEKVKSFEEVDIAGLDGKIKKLTKERDELAQRMETLKKEREDLLVKLQEKPKEKVVFKYVDRKTGEEMDEEAAPMALSEEKEKEAAVQEAAPKVAEAEKTPNDMRKIDVENDEYWAEVLKEKSALELELEETKQVVTERSVELVETKKANSDLQLEITKLTDEKDVIEREIKRGQDLADSLSLALARAKNDKKFLNERLRKLSGENTKLRDHIRELTSTKIALEKSIVRIQDEKKDIEQKLMKTESVIQNRIDEVWGIKESLEDNFQTTKTSDGEVELPPIIVSAAEEEDVPMVNTSVDPSAGIAPGFDGNIVSVNDENNFVIVDIGEDSGLHLGDNLSVYRGAEYIAGLEVIQVRKDIAAADIKSKVVSIKVGDIVR